MITCSLGICVYNEERNLKWLLDSLLKQKLNQVRIGEILIISSGSTDKTEKIIKSYAKKNKRITPIVERVRKGKASAVNLFINNAKYEILVLLGGDLLLEENTIENLVEKFQDSEIGMTGSRPIPLNSNKDSIAGFSAYLLWELHHRVSLKYPKMGEVVAFRKIFKRIPMLSSVDEANIEPLIRGQGYIIKYIPEAKVYNKGPTTVSDFIKQRRRIYSGHLAVKHEQGYSVATLNVWRIFQVLLSFLVENPRPKFLVLTPCVIMLEVYSRFLGWWDFKIAKKRHVVWEIIKTTKDLQ